MVFLCYTLCDGILVEPEHIEEKQKAQARRIKRIEKNKDQVPQKLQE